MGTPTTARLGARADSRMERGRPRPRVPNAVGENSRTRASALLISRFLNPPWVGGWRSKTGIANCYSVYYHVALMTTISLKMPDPLVQDLEAEARRRGL